VRRCLRSEHAEGQTGHGKDGFFQQFDILLLLLGDAARRRVVA
jgi:hypothetical protein